MESVVGIVRMKAWKKSGSSVYAKAPEICGIVEWRAKTYTPQHWNANHLAIMTGIKLWQNQSKS